MEINIFLLRKDILYIGIGIPQNSGTEEHQPNNDLFFFFNLVTWSPRTLQSIYHQISVPKRKENVCLKVLVVEVQIATSSRFPTTVGCFLCSIY